MSPLKIIFRSAIISLVFFLFYILPALLWGNAFALLSIGVVYLLLTLIEIYKPNAVRKYFGIKEYKNNRYNSLFLLLSAIYIIFGLLTIARTPKNVNNTLDLKFGIWGSLVFFILVTTIALFCNRKSNNKILD